MNKCEGQPMQIIVGRSPRISFASMKDWENYINDSKRQPKSALKTPEQIMSVPSSEHVKPNFIEKMNI